MSKFRDKEPERVRIWKTSPSILVAHGATWHFKPGVTKEDYAEEYTKNEAKAERDYAARPPRTVQSALYDKDVIEALANKNRKSPVMEDGSFAEWFKGDPACEYFMHVDMSKSHDSTGYGMSHYNIETGMVVVDLIHTADPTPQWELTFERVYQTILEIHRRGFRLRKVTFDQWQSANMIERLNNYGIHAENYSVDKTTEAYDTLIENLMAKRLDFYYQSRFIEEMRTLRLVGGKKYDHPPQGSKDTADGVAGSVAQCIKARTGTVMTEKEIMDATVISELLLIDESLVETGATVFQINDQPPITKLEQLKQRVCQISADDTALFVLWGYNDRDTERLLVEEYLIWHDFRNETSLYHFEVFMQKLLGYLKIAAVSLNADVPLEIVSFLSTCGVRVSSPLLARAGGGSAGMRKIARTSSVTETSTRSMIAQIKKGNLAFPPHELLIKDFKYLTETNMLEQRYLAPLIEWTDFALRELSFGRASKSMGSVSAISMPPVHASSVMQSQSMGGGGAPAAHRGMGGNMDIKRIRERYNNANSKALNTARSMKGNGQNGDLQPPKMLPRVLRGGGRRG